MVHRFANGLSATLDFQRQLSLSPTNRLAQSRPAKVV